ncbi:MAG: hypothetical protein AB7O43_22335, partial [Hyphomicrobiaceae bacterium]
MDMANWLSDAAGERRSVRIGIGLALALGAGLTMGGLAEPAAAQKGKGKNEAAASKSQPQSAWVKLCEKAKVPKTGADGRPVMTQDRKPVTEEKELCL